MSIDCTSTHIMLLTMVYTNFQTLHQRYENCEIQPKTKAFRRGQRRVRKEARERQHIQNADQLVTLVSTVIKYWHWHKYNVYADSCIDAILATLQGGKQRLTNNITPQDEKSIVKNREKYTLHPV